MTVRFNHTRNVWTTRGRRVVHETFEANEIGPEMGSEIEARRAVGEIAEGKREFVIEFTEIPERCDLIRTACGACWLDNRPECVDHIRSECPF